MLPNHSPSTSFSQKLYGTFGFTLLILLYLLPGAINHEPWRGDDVEHFAIVYALLNGEWLLLPTLAGVPEADFGPLHYWISAVFALAFGWLLPLHDAARLATPAMGILATFWIARAAWRLYGRDARASAALLAIGTLGLSVHVHENQPLITLMAAQAMTLAGLALVSDNPLRGSLQAALGTIFAFLTIGLLGILLTLPLMLITAGSSDCRSPRNSGALILALTLALGGCALWPVLLGLTEPTLLDQWWLRTQISLFENPLGFTDLPRLIEVIVWFTWPLWPIALWALWRARGQFGRLAWTLPLAALLFALAWIVLRGSYDPASMLPLLAPSALLAAAGIATLRRGAANAFDWFAIMTFGVFTLLIWLAWSAQVLEWPPGLTRSLARMAPEFVPTGTMLQAVIGVLIIVIWALLVWHLPRNSNRAPTNWAMGMTMLWCLAVTLLLPWVDHTRNYRPMAESLAQALGKEEALCVVALDLSRSHRATLDYYTGLRPQHVHQNETACRYLITHHDDPDRRAQQPAPPWTPIWEYRHAGGKRFELFQLYRRD